MSGSRYNQGKERLSLILEADKALKGLALVLEHGASKYGRGDWKKGLKWTEVMDSLTRHATQFMAGKNNDPDDKLPHIDHILANALFLSQYYHTRTGTDDRVIYLDDV